MHAKIYQNPEFTWINVNYNKKLQPTDFAHFDKQVL